MKKRQPQTPSIEESAEAYRKCIMSLDGDLDGADQILAEAIRPPCQQIPPEEQVRQRQHIHNSPANIRKTPCKATK